MVVAITGLLLAILFPSLSRARQTAKTTQCLARLKAFGQAMASYATENEDRLLPGRMPRVDDDNWKLPIKGGIKYRPTFLAMLGDQLGLQPFYDPKSKAGTYDRFREPSDRQNYQFEDFVCPVVDEWTDERNGCFGYNYQFLGNARLRDDANPTSFKNWGGQLSRVRSPGTCVAFADCMGTAASYDRFSRGAYANNSTDPALFGNEGFNLDPPRVDPVNGEMAGFGDSPQVRTAIDTRHLERANVIWVDGHGTSEDFASLGYKLSDTDVVELDGNNRFFTTNNQDYAWTQSP